MVINRLFSAMATSGDRAKARKILTDWLATHPDDFDNRITLGNNFMASKEYSAAAALYEAVAPKMPRNSVLFNNLAIAYDHLDDARAVETAKLAYSLAPGTARIADTYGYLLFRKGNAEQGATLVQLAQRSEPHNPTISYHWAEVLAARNDQEGARAILQPLFEEKAGFEDMEAARQLYARVGGK